MSLKVAIQMDPIESIRFETDTTLLLALEAQKRGHTLYYYLPANLSFQEGHVTAQAHRLTVRDEKGNHFTLGPAEIIDLLEFDIVLVRQDPPFDMAYITTTHILEHLQPHVSVFNDPVAIRNAPEKLFVTHFPDLMPPTLITSDRQQIDEFRTKHKDIVIKPLYGFGGSAIFHIGPDDDNLGSLLEVFGKMYREPLVVQKYLPEVRSVGDKRIVLIDGEPAGALLRIPKEGDIRSNMAAGGTAVATELTKRDREICQTIGPALREQGLVLAGIDVIGDYLTEINVTSPTGLKAINRLSNLRLEEKVWDAYESRHARKRREMVA